jgi:hypothetical protein
VRNRNHPSQLIFSFVGHSSKLGFVDARSA